MHQIIVAEPEGAQSLEKKQPLTRRPFHNSRRTLSDLLGNFGIAPIVYRVLFENQELIWVVNYAGELDSKPHESDKVIRTLRIKSKLIGFYILITQRVRRPIERI